MSRVITVAHMISARPQALKAIREAKRSLASANAEIDFSNLERDAVEQITTVMDLLKQTVAKLSEAKAALEIERNPAKASE